jgi:hypothetical protein
MLTLGEELRRGLSSARLLRRVAIPLLARFGDWDVRIKHPYTRERFVLNAFHHKGYWWYGRDRERKTMESLIRIITPGETVIEVGAHIGFLSILFAQPVGSTGRLVVFEPGENNLSYLRENLMGEAMF